MSKIPSARKVWTYVKLWSAVRDLPEIIPLGAAVTYAVTIALYTLKRQYLSLPGEAFPDKYMRHDMERQISYGQELFKPSIFWRVAQLKRDARDGSIDVAVWPFSNKSFQWEHEIPTHPPARQGVPAEGPSPTEY